MKERSRGFGVLADDLTGAMDTGVAFARAGLGTVVSFGLLPEANPEVLVVTTDSRAVKPFLAARWVKAAVGRLAGRYVYKKIDSTLRGNIGVEIRAALEALSVDKAVVCPAFPESGRTVVDGRLLIDGVPLEKTAFVHDSVSPVRTACITELLEGDSGFSAVGLGLSEVERGPRHLSRWLAETRERLIVVDAVTTTHLAAIAGALALSDVSCLPCGAAGLARALPAAFGHSVKPSQPACLTSHGPVLAVVGSRYEIARRQIAVAVKYLKTPLITIQPDEFASPRGHLKGLARTVRAVADFINSGRSVIISSVGSRYLADGQKLTARLLARIAAGVIARASPAGLYLSGGDIAREVARRLGLAGIRITGELEPEMILGKTAGGLSGEMNIVTKAGGFGSEMALADAVYYLERSERWPKVSPS
jgi:uncharacterized protein YgbK (DUF1537 family)